MEKMELLTAKVGDSLSAIKKKLDSFVSEDEAFWMAIAMFLFGVIVGMLISPRKNKSVTIGSNNCAYDCDCDCDDDCDCDCDSDCCCE